MFPILSVLLILLSTCEAAAATPLPHMMPDVPPYTVVPFILMLASIAVGPLFFSHFWEKNRNKLTVSAALAVFPLVWLLMNGHQDHIVHTVVFDYLPFIVLLGSLFVISSGILLTGDLVATPLVNTTFLGIGAVLASFIGTTGAAMLLIRPLLKTNSERHHTVHTFVFFIFIVANIGGCLTPLGDPPLFLGYLRGVPFGWTFRLLLPWLVATGILLTVYFIWDTLAHRHETREDILADETRIEPLRLRGRINFLWLAGIVLCVAFLNGNYIAAIRNNPWLGFVREGAMLLLVGASLLTTRRGVRRDNRFTLVPIIEVAVLFIGIFITMIPALLILEQQGSRLGLTQSWQFFWSTGALSSFLDNAPTYVTFFTAATGQNAADAAALAGQAAPDGMMWVGRMLIDEKTLAAISLGAVFMGANTYIGNGPNFMVKAVAEESGIRMPSFFGYIAYSGLVLLPVFALITFLFFT